jgi:hypothetical protein
MEICFINFPYPASINNKELKHTNPKINNSSTSPAESKDVFSQPIRAARTQKRRSAPLDVFSSNPKTHRKSRKVKRSSRRINRNRHRNPLKETSAQ